MDTQGVKKALEMLAASIDRPMVSAKIAAECVALAQSAVAEVEKTQAEVAEVRKDAAQVVEASKIAVAKAEVVADAAEEQLEQERIAVKRERIEKRDAAETRKVERAIDQARDSLEKSIPELVKTLVALRTRIKNQHGRNVWQTSKDAGHWTLKNMHGVEVATFESRIEAMQTCVKMLELEAAADKKSTVTLEDLDVSTAKMGPSVNVDLPEEHNPGRVSAGNGAAASGWPRRDAEHSGRPDGEGPSIWEETRGLQPEDDD